MFFFREARGKPKGNLPVFSRNAVKHCVFTHTSMNNAHSQQRTQAEDNSFSPLPLKTVPHNPVAQWCSCLFFGKGSPLHLTKDAQRSPWKSTGPLPSSLSHAGASLLSFQGNQKETSASSFEPSKKGHGGRVVFFWVTPKMGQPISSIPFEVTQRTRTQSRRSRIPQNRPGSWPELTSKR